ncbi:MAG: hypothetical protein IPO36_10920 [Anaerolineales bacterium]|nr:hypothetical protein [Anaerolineales bacterium]
MFVKKINMRLVSALCLAVLILTNVDQARAGTFMPTVLSVESKANITASPAGVNPMPRDIMLVIDTTLAMAFATDGDPIL